jgi:hypothetical protein
VLVLLGLDFAEPFWLSLRTTSTANAPYRFDHNGKAWETLGKGFQKLTIPKIPLSKHDISSAVILGVA